jgi:hypothetical protein
MSRFYASIQGSRGETTRQGTVQSGLSGHVRGWNAGVQVEADVFGTQDEGASDRFAVYMTAGSNGRYPRTLLGYVYDGGAGAPYFEAAS